MSSIDVAVDFWLFWLTIALIGPLLYYWFKAVDYLNRLKRARMFDTMGVYDIE